MNKSEIKAIYNEAFGEDNTFFEELFTYAEKCCKTLQINGKTVSMLFLLPVDIISDNLKKRAFYLFAAATKAEHRKKGYMAKLLQSILQDCDIPIILKPANDTLIGYYKKFDFKTFSATYNENKIFSINPVGEFLKLAPQSDDFEGTYTAMYHGDIGFDINGVTFKFTMED